MTKDMGIYTEFFRRKLKAFTIGISELKPLLGKLQDYI